MRELALALSAELIPTGGNRIRYPDFDLMRWGRAIELVRDITGSTIEESGKNPEHRLM